MIFEAITLTLIVSIESLPSNFMSGVQFWIEGVALLVVSLFGVVGNLTTIVVLRRIDSNTTFNRLLMSLCECKISSLVFRYAQ